jgi:twitching motility protein PilT
MAAIDGLLGILLAQGADSLTLIQGEAPRLSRGGEPRPLSMPPLLPELLARFLEEVRATGDGTSYVHDAKGVRTTFVVEVAGPHEVHFRRADAAPMAPAADAPVMAPTPATPAASATPAARPGTVATAPRASASGTAATQTSAPVAPVAELTAAGPARGSYTLPRAGIDPGDGTVAALIRRALEAEATDLFLSTSSDARMRVGMELHELAGTQLDESLLLALLPPDDARHARLDQHGSVDLGLRFGDVKLRVNLFRHLGGLAAAVRPLRRVRTLAELGLPQDLEKLTEPIDGLVLLVGPTGSGKSSTLAALLDHMNHTRSRHILTIEDPVEYEYENGSCLIHQREVGRDVEGFAAGLRAALRESPDVILVGEMRDRETFAAAMTAAETGHLVFSTLHSGNAAMAIDRIVDSFPPHQQTQVRAQLASALRAIVTQLLLPATQPGRLVPATERMFVTHAIAHKIREGRGHQISDLILTGRAEGMVSLETSLAELVRQGRITLATARAAARNPDVMREMLGERR